MEEKRHEIYMNKSVGIGEHSDLIAEMDKYVSKLATAEDNLATLERHRDTLAPKVELKTP